VLRQPLIQEWSRPRWDNNDPPLGSPIALVSPIVVLIDMLLSIESASGTVALSLDSTTSAKVEFGSSSGFIVTAGAYTTRFIANLMTLMGRRGM
jgi:hypothetical protein